MITLKATTAFKLKHDGHVLSLAPGETIVLPPTQAERLLSLAPHKVQIIHDWLGAWRELAQITLGITEEDRRLGTIMTLLDQCDAAFEQDNWTVFQQTAESVKRLVEENEIGG